MYADGHDERPPRLAWGMWKRFLLAAALIVTLTGATTATAILEEVNDTLDSFREPSIPIPGVKNVLDDVNPGRPQTILLLGSDKRFGGEKADVRSDTIILVRLDPEKGATAIMNIPRDLRVDIPGFGTDKINAAYSDGGPNLTVKTVRALLQRTGRDVAINHVVNVNFGGFARAVNRLGCVYADVDRRYFNDNAPPRNSPTNYSVIDLKPGYQKLCGQDALSYVRFRHLDDDFVRAARQQEFLRQAKEQIGLGKLFGDRKKLLNIFGHYTQTDIAQNNDGAILKLLKLAYDSSKNPLQQVRFPGEESTENSFVTVGDERLDKAVRNFLEARGAAPTAPGAAGGSTPKPKKVKKTRSLASGLMQATRAGEDHVLNLTQRLGTALPVYFPGAILNRGGYVDQPAVPSDRFPRSYDIFDRNKNRYRAYRIVLSQGDPGQYYGVEGTTWKAPPILDDPTDERIINGRTFQRYFDGQRIRLIAWKPKKGKGAYWVSNTLSLRLTNKQMMGIAGSLRRVGQ